MTDTRRDRRPGDLILNRAMPDATPEEREEARANLERLAALIARILRRQAELSSSEPTRMNGDGAVQ